MQKRRASTLLVTIILLAAIVAGATLAWLSFRPNALNNTFTYSSSNVPGGRKDEAVAIQLAEPKWSDAVEFNFQEYTHNDGLPHYDLVEQEPGNRYYNITASELADYNFGKVAAKDFTPGTRMLKNPIVKAIGYEPTYVGVKVTGAGGNLNLAQLEKIFTINWEGVNVTDTNPKGTQKPGSKWIQVSYNTTTGDRYFVYADTLYPADLMDRHGGAYNANINADHIWTKELFTFIDAKNNSTQPAKDIYDLISGQGTGAPDEIIKIEAYAVQAINPSVSGWDGADGRGAVLALSNEFGTGNTSDSSWAGITYP